MQPTIVFPKKVPTINKTTSFNQEAAVGFVKKYKYGLILLALLIVFATGALYN